MAKSKEVMITEMLAENSSYPISDERLAIEQFLIRWRDTRLNDGKE